MESSQVILAEKKLNQIARIAVVLQIVWICIIALVFFLKPVNYQLLAKNFSMFALLASFVVSRIYIHFGKIREGLKNFTTEEKEARKKEYFYNFFFPYILWIGCIIVFSVS